MDSDIATAPRNVTKIKARRIKDLSYKSVKKTFRLLGDRQTEREIERVALYPPVDSESDLADLVNRLGWYLPERTNEVTRISIPTTLEPGGASPPDCQPRYETRHLPIETVPPEYAPAVTNGADAVLLWKAGGALNRWVLPNLARTYMIDESFYSTNACDAWEAASERGRQDTVDDSKSNFQRLERRCNDINRAFVFATGPSLSDAMDIEFPEDSVKVVCNSIVKNDDLLSHINPDILVFADPVFHFGPNRYAAKFREDAVETLRTYDCTVILPERNHSLLAGHFPEDSEELIGVETIPSDTPIYPKSDQPKVKATHNVMTLLMLPIASSLTDEVYILGADGREETESYFWEHDDSAQYEDDLMNTAAECHPAYFRDRIYTDYYERHVDTLESMIKYGERQGIDYYNLTHSYIDCLKERSTKSEWD